jgi:hypothetical protein
MRFELSSFTVYCFQIVGGIVTLTGAQADWGLRYLVSNPVPSSGKAADAPIEDFTNGLYLESAKINSFRMHPKNVLKWLLDEFLVLGVTTWIY